MAWFATSSTGPPRHTRPGLGKEERFTPTQKAERPGGTKQARPGQFSLVEKLRGTRRSWCFTPTMGSKGNPRKPIG